MVGMMGIYRISRNHETVYVGQSRNIERRIKDHRRYMSAGDVRHENGYLCNACRKYGIDAFSFEVVEEVECESELTEREGFWIKEFGYPKGNYAIPGDGECWGVSQEFIDEYLKGERNPNYGNRWSDDMKNAASERMRGRYGGERNPNYGNRGEKNPITKHVCPYDKDGLANKLREVGGFCALANELGVPRASVQIWCNNYGIPYKKRDYVEFGVPEPPMTREEFIDLNAKMTYAQMAEHFGVSKWAIEKWRDQLRVGKRFARGKRGGGSKCREEK